MNELAVNQSLFEAWQTPDRLQPHLWKARYAKLLDGPWYDNFEQYDMVMNNPYYAVVNSTAFVLTCGSFRGYEHFASVFFAEDSKHDLGVVVHKERTRTSMKDGRYVTDWYIKVTGKYEATEHEQMYRAAVGMLVASELPPNWTHSLRRFTVHNTLNIRTKDDGNSQAQISSQG